jgi:type IV pilus assembly protein PilP
LAWLPRLAIALTGAALLAGCNSDMSDLERFVAETKLKHQGRVDPLPDFAQYESFTYSETDLRDPFKPHVDVTTETTASSSGPRPSEKRRREALESYPLDALRMVGILQQSTTSWALIQDPEGTIHRVQPGNYAGQNHGKITGISENQISLVELIPDGISGWIQRDAQLALGDEE